MFRGFLRTLGHVQQVQVGLNGRNAGVTRNVFHVSEHALVSRDHKPEVCPLGLLVKSETVKQSLLRRSAEIDSDQPKASERSEPSRRGKTGEAVLDIVLASGLSKAICKLFAGPSESVASDNSMAAEVVLVLPRVQQEVRIARTHTTIVCFKQTVVSESGDYLADKSASDPRFLRDVFLLPPATGIKK